jgi:hypothetical protein
MYCPVTNKLYGVRPYNRKSTDVTIYDLRTNEKINIDLGCNCYSCEVSSTGHSLLVRTQFGQVIWDLDNMVKVCTLEIHFLGVCLSSGGDRIITRIHERIRIYNSTTGNALLSFDALRVVTGMQVAGEWLVEHSPKEIGIWDIGTGVRLFEVTSGLLNITTVCIGCGGGTIAAACWDHTSTNQLLCWNVEDKSLGFYVIIAKCTALTLSPISSNFHCVF